MKSDLNDFFDNIEEFLPKKKRGRPRKTSKYKNLTDQEKKYVWMEKHSPVGIRQVWRIIECQTCNKIYHFLFAQSLMWKIKERVIEDDIEFLPDSWDSPYVYVEEVLPLHQHFCKEVAKAGCEKCLQSLI